MTKNKIDLRDLYADLQTELASRLGTARRNLRHPGAKGEVTEQEWRDLLRRYLPQRYAIAKGFVVDSESGISDEIDVIVHDRFYSPLIFHHARTCYVPAESVYAVIEVKPELSKATIDYAGAKAASVRRLHRTSVRIQHAGGAFDPSAPSPILAALVATTSSWTPPMGDSLRSALSDLSAESRLDLGCAASGGAFHMLGEGGVETVGDEQALVYLLLKLLHGLQQRGTATAMDYGAYARVLVAAESGEA